MRKTWAGCVGLSLGLLAAGAHADDIQWRPSGNRPAPVATANTPVTPAPYAAPPASYSAAPVPRRAASLGLPIAASAPSDPAPAPLDASVTQATFNNGVIAASPAPIVRAQSPDPLYGPTLAPPPPGYAGSPPPPPPPSTPAPLGGYPMPNEEMYNRGVVTQPPGGGGRAGGFSGESLFGTFTSPNRCLFQSDHCFDNFISPITNPFLFEDPRALTEFRPIFMQQGAPSSNWVFHGGNAQFLGSQFRLAITDRVSVVINKFGGVWTEPNNPPPGFGDSNGFAEFWFGPKWTFLRNENTGTLGAFGWTFEIPTGSGAYQNAGGYSNTPYFTFAQNFWRTSYGSMNAMGTVGYTFDSSDKRSDYIFLSGHLDYDILQAHTWYPVLEMHFFDYTQAGTTRNLGFEGRDLINFGSQAVSGRKYMTIAPGFRWVFWKGQNNASAQTGVGVELPIVGSRDILDYRLTWDFIVRY